jgi:hypothetical protein
MQAAGPHREERSLEHQMEGDWGQITSGGTGSDCLSSAEGHGASE